MTWTQLNMHLKMRIKRKCETWLCRRLKLSISFLPLLQSTNAKITVPAVPSLQQQTIEISGAIIDCGYILNNPSSSHFRWTQNMNMQKSSLDWHHLLSFSTQGSNRLLIVTLKRWCELGLVNIAHSNLIDFLRASWGQIEQVSEHSFTFPWGVLVSGDVHANC